MPLAVLELPCRTSVLSAASPLFQRPRCFTALMLIEPLRTYLVRCGERLAPFF